MALYDTVFSVIFAIGSLLIGIHWHNKSLPSPLVLIIPSVITLIAAFIFSFSSFSNTFMPLFTVAFSLCSFLLSAAVTRKLNIYFPAILTAFEGDLGFLLLPALTDGYDFAIIGEILLISLFELLISKTEKKREVNWILSVADKKTQLLTVWIPVGLSTVIAAGLFAMSGRNYIGAIILLVFTVLLNIGSYIAADRSVIALKNAEMDRWLRESTVYMNTIRSQRHDFNLHLHAISGLVRKGKYDECGEYVRNLTLLAEDINDIMPVYDAVIGSMFLEMRNEARKKGSDILYDIQYDMKDIICSGFEFNKIAGNLIQNAIDAINEPEELKAGISVIIRKRNGFAIVKVSNLFTGDKTALSRAFESGFSGKARHEGIGLSTSESALKKYGGTIGISIDKDMVNFTASIPIRITFEGGES